MSYMTTKLRYVVEQALDDKLLEHTETNWPQIYSQLGLDDYPVWSGGKVVTGPCEERTRINNKLIRHYYMREIGLETIALFTWYLRDSMLNIMPYYNVLFSSAELITDPLKEFEESMAEGHEETRDTDETRKADETRNTDETTTSKNDRKRTEDTVYSDTNIYSETPENMISSGDVKALKYATNVTYDDSTTGVTEDTSDTGEGSLNRNDTLTRDDTLTRGENVGYTGKRSRYGHNSSQMELVRQFREQIRNIDFELIRDPEIQSCFMMVYE